jgi:hypothetical protein
MLKIRRYAQSMDEQEIQENGSEELDLVTVFEGAGTNNEMEAMSVQALLEANGIQAVIIGDAVLPNLEEDVRVPRQDLDRAQKIIADALAAGPAAALEAEMESEQEKSGS